MKVGRYLPAVGMYLTKLEKSLFGVQDTDDTSFHGIQETHDAPFGGVSDTAKWCIIHTEIEFKGRYSVKF